MFCCLLLLNKLFSFVHPCRSAGCCYRKFRVSLTVSVWVTLLPLPPAGSEVWSQVQVVCVWVPVWVGVVSSSELTWQSVIWSLLDNKEWIYKVLPVSGWISRWRYDSEEILTHRAVQAWSLIKRQKFGGDRTLHTGVMTTSCPLARDDPSPHFNVYTPWVNVKILIMIQWLDWALLSCLV